MREDAGPSATDWTPNEERPSHEAEARASIDVLRERMRLVPEALEEVLRQSLEKAARVITADVVTTGIGASAGPARLFAWLLAERLRVAARFVPLSAFAGEDPPVARTLVLVSQGLSPNARLALRHATRFDKVLVLTSVQPSCGELGPLLAGVTARGGEVVVLPPAGEDGLLLRVIGPSAAALAAMSIVESACGSPLDRAFFHEVPRAVAACSARASQAAAHVPSDALDGPCAFVSVGIDPAALQAHRWKWLEGLRNVEPFGWDVMEIAHGPIQAATRPMPFVVLAGRGSEDLVLRLLRVLSKGGHPSIVLRSELAPPLSFLEHDAQLGALLLRVLDERPRDLRAHAAAAFDEPLYGLGR